MSTSSQRSGWDYATGMAEQWSGSTDYSSTMSFLEQHDPFPAGFEVELGQAGSRLPGAIVGRLRLGRWQVVLENGSEVEAKQMGDFLRRWRANDPNGVWGFAVELDEALLVTRVDGEDPDYFGTAGFDVDGSPLYDLTGWVWVVLPGRV